MVISVRTGLVRVFSGGAPRENSLQRQEEVRLKYIINPEGLNHFGGDSRPPHPARAIVGICHRGGR